MQDRTEIIRTPASLNYQLVFFSATYLILAAVSIFILIVPFRFFDASPFIWLLVFSIIAILFYMLSVYALKKKWRSVRYYLAKDCLIIASGFTAVREDVYRYETINNVSLQQTNTEVTRGYGRLVLSIDKVTVPVVLSDVICPKEVLESLQTKIVTASQIRFNR